VNTWLIIGSILVLTSTCVFGGIYTHAGLSFTYDDQYQVILDTHNNVILSQNWMELRFILGLSHTIIYITAEPNSRISPENFKSPEKLATGWMMESGDFSQSTIFGDSLIRSQIPTYIKDEYKGLVSFYDIDSDRHVIVSWSEPGVDYVIATSTIPGWWQRDISDPESEALRIAKSVTFSK
jgi:hypothetical protein